MNISYKILNNPLFSNKSVSENLFYLTINQIVTYVFPLITLPYLYRVLGVEQMGLALFAQAFLQYFIIFTDYGFELTATRRIAISKENHKLINKIFNEVITIKLLLLFISILIFLLVVLFIPKFNQNTWVYIIILGILAGQVLFPVWLFQGLEKMSYITWITSFMKILGLIAIFIFIKSKNDLYLYLIIFSGIMFFTGLIGFIIAVKEFSISYQKVSLNDIYVQLKEGRHIFLSNMNTIFIMVSNVVILGLLTNNTIVGYFSIVERPIMAIRGFVVVFFRSAYPQICQLAQQDYIKVKQFLKHLMIPVILIFLFITLIIIIFANWIVFILAGQYIPYSALLLTILSFIPIIVLFNVPAYQILLAYKFEKEFFKISFQTMVICILLNIILGYFYQGLGTSITIVLIESIFTIRLYLKVKELRPIILNKN